MFRYGVSAALHDLPQSQPVTLRGSPLEVFADAAGIGYDAVELHLEQPARYDAAEILNAANKYGIRVCAIATGMEYTRGGLNLADDDPEKREAAVKRLYEHADLAGKLGAKLIVGIMRGNVPPGGDMSEYARRLGDSLKKVCAYGAQRGVDVALESILRYINNYLNSISETMDFIQSLNIPNLSLHIDTHSMAMEEICLKDSILNCAGKPLGYVHYSDNNRRYPGGGALDFMEITAALLKIGYEGYITLECLPWPDARESAARGLEVMRSAEKIARQKQAINL